MKALKNLWGDIKCSFWKHDWSPWYTIMDLLYIERRLEEKADSSKQDLYTMRVSHCKRCGTTITIIR